MTASTSSGRSLTPRRRPVSPTQQRAGDRTLTIGFDELEKVEHALRQLAAGAHNFGGTELLDGGEFADHSLPRDASFQAAASTVALSA